MIKQLFGRKKNTHIYVVCSDHAKFSFDDCCESKNYFTAITYTIQGYVTEKSPLHKLVQMDGWMTCDFTSVSTVFQLYQDDERLIIKGCLPHTAMFFLLCLQRETCRFV